MLTVAVVTEARSCALVRSPCRFANADPDMGANINRIATTIGAPYSPSPMWVAQIGLNIREAANGLAPREADHMTQFWPISKRFSTSAREGGE
jgi:hypothetical protein